MAVSSHISHPYSPVASFPISTNGKQNNSDAITNRTTSIARLVLNEDGHEVVLEGKDAEAYIVGAQFLEGLVPLFENIINEMLADPELFKFFEESGKNQMPFLPNGKVEELDSEVFKKPLQQPLSAY